MAAASERAVSAARYSTTAIILHWLIAALIVLQVVLASRMQGRPTPQLFAVTQLHKSIGVTVLILSLARLTARVLHPPPPFPPAVAAWERRLARWTHLGFYVVMLGMPVTGWLIVSTSRIALPTLLYGELPWPMIPGFDHLAPAARAAWHAVAVQGHATIIKFAYVLIALHVTGALKHQLFSADEPVLPRMAPGAKPGRRLEPRLLAIAGGFLGVVAVGLWIQPPIRSVHAQPSPAFANKALELGPPPAANASVARAASAPKPSSGAALAQPSHWVVEQGSRLGFSTSWSGQPIEGRFDRWRADITFSPDALDRSRVRAQIDLASASTGDAQRDQTLPSEDWFDVARHRSAVFVATKFSRLGADRYLARGTLELKGVKKPVDLVFKLTLAKGQATAVGRLSLNRTEFRVGEGEFASTAEIPDSVTVTVKVQARAEN